MLLLLSISRDLKNVAVLLACSKERVLGHWSPFVEIPRHIHAPSIPHYLIADTITIALAKSDRYVLLATTGDLSDVLATQFLRAQMSRKKRRR